MNLKPGLKKLESYLSFLDADNCISSGRLGSSDGGLQNDSLAPNFKLQNLDEPVHCLKGFTGKSRLNQFLGYHLSSLRNEMPLFSVAF